MKGDAAEAWQVLIKVRSLDKSGKKGVYFGQEADKVVEIISDVVRCIYTV